MTEYVATTERANRKFPLLLTTGRILSQYNVGAQTRRTDNSEWHGEDLIEIHPHDADQINSEKIAQLSNLADSQSVVAIGETGLDFNRNYSTTANQIAAFPY